MDTERTEAAPEKLWVTIADPEQPAAELARLKIFLERNPSSNLADRPDPIFQASIEDALSFRIQSAALVDDDGLHICAQGGVFGWAQGRGFEIGGINVATAYRGLGLQKLLMRTAIVRIVEQDINIVNDPNAAIFAAVADDNEPSWRSIEGVGFVQAESTDIVWSLIGKSQDVFTAKGKRLYRFPIERLAVVCAAMAQFAADPELRSETRWVRVIFGEALERYAAPSFFDSFAR